MFVTLSLADETGPAEPLGWTHAQEANCQGDIKVALATWEQGKQRWKAENVTDRSLYMYIDKRGNPSLLAGDVSFWYLSTCHFTLIFSCVSRNGWWISKLCIALELWQCCHRDASWQLCSGLVIQICSWSPKLRCRVTSLPSGSVMSALSLRSVSSPLIRTWFLLFSSCCWSQLFHYFMLIIRSEWIKDLSRSRVHLPLFFLLSHIDSYKRLPPKSPVKWVISVDPPNLLHSEWKWRVGMNIHTP